MAQDTFIIRAEWYDAISELDDAGQAVMFRNLFHYHRGEVNLINLDNLSVKLVWKVIEHSLRRSVEKYDKRVETSRANGRLGGRPRSKSTDSENLKNLPKASEKPKEPTETLSDRDSVLREEEEESADAQDFSEEPLLAPNRPGHAPDWHAVRELFEMSNGTPAQAIDFFRHNEDRGWVDKYGRPYLHIAGAVNGWISSAAERKQRAAEKSKKKPEAQTYQLSDRDQF